jgi:hypothetical protein
MLRTLRAAIDELSDLTVKEFMNGSVLFLVADRAALSEECPRSFLPTFQEI